MRVLIVGAGSVGQLYGFFFQRGGAAVDVYVRPEYADEARAGFQLYDRKQGLTSPELFSPDGVATTPDDIETHSYDAVVLCIPSTGLHGDWFEDFASSIGDATLISLTPGLEDRDFITQFLDLSQVGVGAITAVAYPAPLPGESAEVPGTAYWFPPLAPAVFEGLPQRIDPVIAVLRKGGMNSRRIKDVTGKSAFVTGVLTPLVAALESADWSFSDLRSDKTKRRHLYDATQESLADVEAHLEQKRPLPMRLLSPTALRVGLSLAGAIPPFDLETYLQVHFTKVGAQTRRHLGEYIRRRGDRGMESPALEALLGTIDNR